MKAMLLAAGRGTRLRPLTERVPKCMIPVGEKPLIQHTLERLVSFGITEIVINVSHLAAMIVDHFGDGSDWGASITYSKESQPLGTAGGVRNVSALFDDTFLIWYADNLSQCDLRSLCDLHRSSPGVATIAVHHRDDVSQSGIVELDEGDRVVRFVEKPDAGEAFSNLVNAGIYVMEPEVLNYISDEGTPDFGRDVFPILLSRGESIFGYRLSAEEGLYWVDRPEDLRRLPPARRVAK